jgi:peptidyl-prolyl cis-trans isomerase SurA
MNFRNKINALALFSGLTMSLNVFGQTDPVLFTVQGVPVNVSEFKYIYAKTNGDKADFSEKSLREYLDLYTKFKLKVARAREMRLDTIPALKEELNGYRRQLADSYLTDREVTDKLVREAYSRIQKDVNISHILAVVDKNNSDEVAYKKILALKVRLDKGEDFVKLAKEASEDKTSKESGGVIGYVTAMLPDGFYQIESAAYNTEVGKISEPVKSPLGWHLIRVNDKRDARGEMEVAHILIRKAKDGVAQTNAKFRIDSLHKVLSQPGADFNEIARVVSEDGYSAPRGGYLGFFGIGRYEKNFEDVAFDLRKDNDFSKPFESSLGWHIIKRVSRKLPDAFEAQKMRLKGRIQKDGRYELAKQSMLERIKRENKFAETKGALDKAIAGLDSNFMKFTWKVPEPRHTNALFTFGNDKTVTIGDFYEYMSENGNQRVNGGETAAASAKKLYADFVNRQSMAYEEQVLDKKYPDFKALMREYEEGILLFEAIKINVWDKAATDSLGLDKFFADRKDKYMWEERAVLIHYTLADSAKSQIDALRKFASKENPADVLKKFNQKGALEIVAFKEDKVEKGKNKVVDALAWKSGSLSANELNKRDNSINFIKIEKILPKTRKTLKEARGYVVADYQDFLEKKWIEDLTAKYKVQVTEKSLMDLVKK